MVIRKSDMIIDSDITRGRGRVKLTLDAVVKNDMIVLNLREHLALDRAQWCHDSFSCTQLIGIKALFGLV